MGLIIVSMVRIVSTWMTYLCEFGKIYTKHTRFDAYGFIHKVERRTLGIS